MKLSLFMSLVVLLFLVLLNNLGSPMHLVYQNRGRIHETCLVRGEATFRGGRDRNVKLQAWEENPRADTEKEGPTHGTELHIGRGGEGQCGAIARVGENGHHNGPRAVR
jgi:hypothetical protein